MKPRGALWRTTHITKRLQLSRRAERFSTRNGNSIFSARCRHLCLSSTPRRCGGFFLRRIAANTVRKSSPKAAAKYSRSSAIGDCVARPAATVADAIISVSISLQQARKSGSCYSRTADPIFLKPGDMPPKRRVERKSHKRLCSTSASTYTGRPQTVSHFLIITKSYLNRPIRPVKFESNRSSRILRIGSKHSTHDLTQGFPTLFWSDTPPSILIHR